MTETEALADVIAMAVHTATAPLLAKIAVLEARPYVTQDLLDTLKENAADLRARFITLEARVPIPGPPGPMGPQGEKGDSVIGPEGKPGRDGKDGVDGIGIKGDTGARGQDGKDADPVAIQRTVEELVTKAVAAIPAPKDGRDGKDGIGIKGDTGDRGADGKDADMALVQRTVEQLVTKAVAAIPTPKDGRDGKDGVNVKGDPGADGRDGVSITVADVAPLVSSEVQKAVSAIRVPKDGVDGKDGIGVMDAMLDRAGQLVVTFSDGRTKTIGTVVGKDGENGSNGQPGKDVDLLFVQDFVTKELAKWPKPENGRDGKDGAPGLSPDDFDWDFNPETRELSITFLKDGKVVAERTKVLRGMRIYRKVYETGRTYEEGDVVTWDGSEWTALTHTKERPGAANSDWKLTVKHGAEGKRGPEGKPGRDGKDLTQLGYDGKKW